MLRTSLDKKRQALAPSEVTPRVSARFRAVWDSQEDGRSGRDRVTGVAPEHNKIPHSAGLLDLPSSCEFRSKHPALATLVVGPLESAEARGGEWAEAEAVMSRTKEPCERDGVLPFSSHARDEA